MNSNSIIQYKPLIKVTDLNKEEYYTEASMEEFEMMLAKNERITFSFSGDCVKTSMIMKHRLADPDEVMFAWEKQKLTWYQKKALDAGITKFNLVHNYTKPITKKHIDRFIENIKAGREPFSEGTNLGSNQGK